MRKEDFEDPDNAAMVELLVAASCRPSYSGYGVDLSDMNVTMVRRATLDKINELLARIEALERALKDIRAYATNPIMETARTGFSIVEKIANAALRGEETE